MQHSIRRGTIGLVVVALIMPLLAACGGQSEAQLQSGDLTGNITVSGANALYPLMVQWSQEFQKLHPGVKFDVSAGGAGKGMTDVLSGVSDIGMVSRSITAQEESNGAYWVPVVTDSVFPAINTQNPALKDLLARGMSHDVLVKIFLTGEIKTWGEVIGRPEVKDEIHVYTRSDSSGAADAWASYLGKKQDALKGIGVNGDPGMLEALGKDPLGIGYSNLAYAFDAASGKPQPGLTLLPVDANNNTQADAEEVLDTRAKAIEAVANGKYPSPPVRPDSLVTKGKASGLAQAFLLWVLTDGQKFVDSAGLVPLPSDQLISSLAKVK